MLVEKININREVPSLIYMHSLTLVLRKTEKKGGIEKEDQCLWCLALMLGVWSLSLYETLFFGHCILVIYIEEVFDGFFPLGFPRVNCCVPYDCVSFSDPLYMFLL